MTVVVFFLLFSSLLPVLVLLAGGPGGRASALAPVRVATRRPLRRPTRA
jgi:hypothetical protein